MNLKLLSISLVSAFLATACGNNQETQKETTQTVVEIPDVKHPEWAKNATIYEMNIRQYTQKGDFNSIIPHLPRLKAMGVDIIWVMPINPIGEKNRKGGQGSYYSVKDYKAINPEYGTMEDFKNFVNAIHDNGMKIIVDWVANHTAWDHPWTANKDWYTLDSLGNFKPPVADWSDVIDLNFENKDMRKAMIEAMQFWVKEANIDGYRCDVAMEVPTDFWNETRFALDTIKPVFMLAEAEQKDHHQKAFDMSYGWELLHVMNGIAKGEKNLNDLRKYIAKNDSVYNNNEYRMNFVTNHDENSWNGTEYERYKEAVKAYTVLAYTLPGMPLVYSGQENNLNRALAFFEKDSISWGNYENQAFLSKLLLLNKNNKALWNGNDGGKFEEIETDKKDEVFAYKLQKEDKKVIVIINFSKKPIEVNLEKISGAYNNVFTGESFGIKGKTKLEGNGYLVLE